MNLLYSTMSSLSHTNSAMFHLDVHAGLTVDALTTTLGNGSYIFLLLVSLLMILLSYRWFPRESPFGVSEG